MTRSRPASRNAARRTPAAARSADGNPHAPASPSVRSTAAPPEAHRHDGQGWLIAFGVLLLWAILAHNSTAWAGFTDRVDSAILRQVARLRTPWLTDVADAVESGFSFWLTTLATVALIVLLTVFKRWRHLFTLLGSMVAAAGHREDDLRPTSSGRGPSA